MIEDEVQSERTAATGDPSSTSEKPNNHLIVYPLGQYEIVIRLSENNSFLDVVEVRVNKDFRSLSQRIASTGHHNAEQFYER